MTDFDTRLSRAFEADLPPARDAMFRLAVQAKLERQQYHRRMALVIVLGLLASVALWFLTAGAVQVVSAIAPSMAVTLVLSLLLAASAGGWGVILAVRAR